MDRAFAIILYMLPIRLMGRKSPTVSGSFVLGTRVRNEALQPFSILPVLSKCLSALTISSFNNSQYLFMNLNENPSGPGDFSLPHDHIAPFISSTVNGTSRLALDAGSREEKLRLKNLGLKGHFSWNLI